MNGLRKAATFDRVISCTASIPLLANARREDAIGCWRSNKNPYGFLAQA